MGILKRILPPIIFALTLPVMAQVALNTLTSTGVVDFAVLNENFTNLAVGVNQSAKTNDAVFLNALTNAVQPPTTSGNTGSVSIVGRQFLINFPSPQAATGAVVSVNGEVGVVILNTDEIGEASTNLYFLHSRVTTNVTVTNLQNATNDLSIRVISMETGMLSRISWGTSVAAQVTSGQTGNWHAAFTGRLTLISWGTSVAAQITAGETGNWTAAYNAIGTNKFNEIWIGRPAQTGTNLTGLTAAYTSDITTTPIVWTSTTPITAHQTYIAGFHKSNAVGSVTMSVGGITIAATADGAASNWFATADTSLTNVTLSLNGDGVNLTLVSNVYVKAITNGSGYFADDIYVGDRIFSPNPIAYITDLTIVSNEVDAIQSNYLSLVSWGTSVAARITSGDTSSWQIATTSSFSLVSWGTSVAARVTAGDTNLWQIATTSSLSLVSWGTSVAARITSGDTNSWQIATTSSPTLIAFNNTNAGFNTRIASTETATNALNTQVTNLNNSTNALNTRMASAETATNALNTRAANLETATNALNTRAASLETSTNALNTRASNLESATNALNISKARTNQFTDANGVTYTATNAPAAAGYVLKFDPTTSNSQFAADNDAAVSYGITDTTAYRGDWGDNASGRVVNLEGATNALNTRANNLETSTNALNTRAGSLETSTNALNTRANNLEAATNNLNANKLSLSGGTMSGTLNMGAQNVTNAIYYGDGGGITNLTGAEPLWSAASNQVQTDIDNLESATSSLNANKLSLSGGTMTGQLKLGGNLDVNGYSATNFDSIIFRQTGPTALILFDPNDNPVSARYGFFRGTTTTNMYLQLNNTMGADDFDIKEQGGNILARFSAKDNNVQIPNLKVTTALNMGGNPITNVNYVQQTNAQSFRATMKNAVGGAQTVGTGTNIFHPWTNTQFNYGGAFDTSTGRFTPTVPGRYLITGGLGWVNSSFSVASRVQIRIIRNDTAIKWTESQTHVDSAFTSTIISMIIDVDSTGTNWWRVMGINVTEVGDINTEEEWSWCEGSKLP